MHSLDGTLGKLGRAQSEFFRAADAISPEQWNTQPRRDEWSAAEVVAHLVMVERAVVGGADRIRKKPETVFNAEPVAFADMVGGEPVDPEKNTNPAGSRIDGNKRRDVGGTASGARTNASVHGRNERPRFE